jgi:hypothetical protein
MVWTLSEVGKLDKTLSGEKRDEKKGQAGKMLTVPFQEAHRLEPLE